MGEGEAQAVRADVPAQGVGVGRGFEVGEERDGAFEGGEFARGDGREARVVERTGVLLISGCVACAGKWLAYLVNA